MSGSIFAQLQKQISRNYLLHNLRMSMFPSEKKIISATIPRKNCEKQYNAQQQYNKLSYEDFLRINWRRST